MALHKVSGVLQISNARVGIVSLLLTSSLRPSGPPGASASPQNIYGYLGCYVHTGSPSVTSGRALPAYQTSYPTLANSKCSAACLGQGTIYFGTLNVGSTTVECWCGNQIAYVTVVSGILGGSSVTGNAGDNNCYPCIGGALSGGVSGACGNSSASTMAIYARGF
ncbi:hypothetical protein WHR41_07128 [Cladosporium halotolerans]|uniref:WSC domain-containing protein n=1 Tax=Cladosporium halotolerans TaxID=1052096 RepID=A0AB34KJR9_9PEZI